MSRLLKAFIIGSSLPVVAHFYVATALNKKKNFSYEAYSFIAPTFFGIISVLLAYFFEKPVYRNYFIAGILTSFFVLSINYTFKVYPFANWQQWMIYYSRLTFAHIVSLSIIYLLFITI